MSETLMVPVNAVFPIELSLWNGAAFLTGQTVPVSIERFTDGYYWTGSAWQAGYTTFNLTERSGTADLAGKYRYLFTVPAGIYDVHCTFTSGDFTTHFRWRLIGTSFGGVIAGPVTSVTMAAQRVEAPVLLEMFAEETRALSMTVNDGNGDPINLSAVTLRFVVQDSNEPPGGEFKIEDGEIARSGEDNEIATITVDGTQAPATTSEWHWRLWDLDNDRVLQHGPFRVLPARKDVS